MNKQGNNMLLKVGDKISWSSMGGDFIGDVVHQYKALNAANKMVDWVHISYISKYGKTVVARFLNSNDYLVMMKVVVL